MNNRFTGIAVIFFAAMVLMAFMPQLSASITGKVVPADGAEMVWAIKGADSLSAKTTEGTFLLDVKPGIYKVIVDAKTPYKDLLIEKVEVTEGGKIDLGEIKLEK
jgi:hypothetical protein